MATATFFYVGCDTQVVVNGLIDDTGAIVANATLVADMFLTGSKVTPSPISFTAVGGTPGDYQCTIPSTLQLQNGKLYALIVTASLTNGKIVQFQIQRTAKVITV